MAAEALPEKGPNAGMPDWLRFPLVLGMVGAVSAAALGTVYGLTEERIRASQNRKIEGAFASILNETYGGFEARTSAGISYYELRDRSGAPIGYAIEASCPGSYNKSEPVRLIAAFDSKLERLLGVRIIASKETPGLGEKANDVPPPRSILDILAGRPAKSRVALKGGGALVGRIEKRPDGTIAVNTPGGEKVLSEADVAAVTEAPFPPAFMDQFTGRSLVEAKLVRDGGKIDAITGATITSRAIVGGVALAAERLRNALAEKR